MKPPALCFTYRQRARLEAVAQPTLKRHGAPSRHRIALCDRPLDPYSARSVSVVTTSFLPDRTNRDISQGRAYRTAAERMAELEQWRTGCALLNRCLGGTFAGQELAGDDGSSV